MKNIRFLLLAAVAFFGVSSYALAEETEVESQTHRVQLSDNSVPSELRIYGDADLKKTIYVFSSISCPHCAVYHEDVLPELLTRFVATKKAKLVYVDMPYDARALTGTLYSRCVQPKNYDAYMRWLFENQQKIASAEKPRQMMIDHAVELGEDQKKLEACVSQKELRRAVVGQRDNLSGLYSVQGMPTTIVVTGKVLPQRFVGSDTQVILAGVAKSLGE